MNDIELLKRSRAVLDLTQKQIAKQLGVAHVTVGQWECGARKPGKEAFRAILELIVKRVDTTAGRQGFVEEMAQRLNKNKKGGDSGK